MVTDDMAIEQIYEEAKRKFDERYLQDFLYACLTEDDLDVLERNLPDPNYHGYIELMNLLEQKAIEEIGLYLEMGENDPNLYDTLSKAKARLTLIQSKIATYNESLEEEKKSEISLDDKKVIYLRSKNGNAFFENDLEKLEPNSYGDFEKAFSLLRNGGNVFLGDSKMKDLSNNRELKGVKESKDFQSRIFYMHLMDRFVLVIMGAIKKDDDPKLLREQLTARRKLALEAKPIIMEQLQNPETREKLISENDIITERIDEKLSVLKRGRQYE